MAKKYDDEAIVLRTFNVGETDRFCLLLTKKMGRVAARVYGARTVKSRQCRGLLTLHRVQVTLEEHSFGMKITEALDTTEWATIWHDPEKFSMSCSLIEMIIRSTEEGVPLPEVYQLLEEFLMLFSTCSLPSLPSVCVLQYLSLLGYIPSADHCCVSHLPMTEDQMVCFSAEHGAFCKQELNQRARILSTETRYILTHLTQKSAKDLMLMSQGTQGELSLLTQFFVGAEFGGTLISPLVSAAISSGVTPIS
jgi:DNA repair protein RecO (recombination protein O)